MFAGQRLTSIAKSVHRLSLFFLVSCVAAASPTSALASCSLLWCEHLIDLWPIFCCPLCARLLQVVTVVPGSVVVDLQIAEDPEVMDAPIPSPSIDTSLNVDYATQATLSGDTPEAEAARQAFLSELQANQQANNETSGDSAGEGGGTPVGVSLEDVLQRLNETVKDGTFAQAVGGDVLSMVIEYTADNVTFSVDQDDAVVEIADNGGLPVSVVAGASAAAALAVAALILIAVVLLRRRRAKRKSIPQSSGASELTGPSLKSIGSSHGSEEEAASPGPDEASHRLLQSPSGKRKISKPASLNITAGMSGGGGDLVEDDDTVSTAVAPAAEGRARSPLEQVGASIFGEGRRSFRGPKQATHSDVLKQDFMESSPRQADAQPLLGLAQSKNEVETLPRPKNHRMGADVAMQLDDGHFAQSSQLSSLAATRDEARPVPGPSKSAAEEQWLPRLRESQVNSSPLGAHQQEKIDGQDERPGFSPSSALVVNVTEPLPASGERVPRTLGVQQQQQHRAHTAAHLLPAATHSTTELPPVLDPQHRKQHVIQDWPLALETTSAPQDCLSVSPSDEGSADGLDQAPFIIPHRDIAARASGADAFMPAYKPPPTAAYSRRPAGQPVMPDSGLKAASKYTYDKQVNATVLPVPVPCPRPLPCPALLFSPLLFSPLPSPPLTCITGEHPLRRCL